MITANVFFLLLFGVFLNASAQLLLKLGLNRIGEFSFTIANLWPISWKVATDSFIIFGLSCYVVSVVIWLMVLSRVPVGIAYPMVSIGYIITAIAGFFFFGEPNTGVRIICIFLIF